MQVKNRDRSESDGESTEPGWYLAEERNRVCCFHLNPLGCEPSVVGPRSAPLHPCVNWAQHSP